MLEKLSLLYLGRLGIKKSERLNLKLLYSKLIECSKIKYFGIILDNMLDWKSHITELSKKLSRAVDLLYPRSLYFSLFNSHLSYGFALWAMQIVHTSIK